MKRYFVIALAIFTYSSLFASSPQIKKYRTRSDFERGESKGISITNEGELLLAPAVKVLCETNETAVWDIVSAPSGNIYYSAGNEGKVYQITPGKKSHVLSKMEEIQVYALAVSANGTLYAASSPEGKVYKISKNGNVSVFFDPPDYYIWDLLYDANMNLYVATGDSGNIYVVRPDGKSNIFYKSEDRHVRSLTMDKKGNIIAGTSGKGYIYRIKPNGDAFVIYDADLEEIQNIEVSKDGIIYAAALGERSSMPLKSAPEQKKTKEKQGEDPEIMDNGAIVIGEIKIEAPRAPASMEIASQSAIYKIYPNGIVRNIWEFYREPVQSMTLSKEGKLLVGTGKKGKLIEFSADDEISILLSVDQSQITSFTNMNDGSIIFGTANMAMVYQLESRLNKEGSFLSPVYDSYSISKWGNLRWQYEEMKGSKVSFLTRSGNTEVPNSTWSEWSSAYTNSEGESIRSPESRFLQWRLDLTAGKKQRSAKIKEVNLSYLQKNLPPQILDITIYPQGEYIQNASSGRTSMENEVSFSSGSSAQKSNSRNKYYRNKLKRKGYRTVSWQVLDDNDDNLNFHLFYREGDETKWRSLTKKIPSTTYAWDTQRLPDGTYFLKLVATDSLSNPHDLALTAVKESESFDIDNTGPVVSNISPRILNAQLQLTFSVTDKYNVINNVEYSLDGDDWKTIYPIDSINDSKLEKFRINCNIKKTGTAHSIVVKALDSVDNIGFGKTHFKE